MATKRSLKLEDGGEKVARKSLSVVPGRDPHPHMQLKHRRTTLERIEKFISSLYFTNVNLFGRLYGDRLQIKDIQHRGPTGRISYRDGIGEKSSFKPFAVGQSFGPTFTTHWFKLEIEIPKTWIGQKVQLIWDSGCEGMIWRDDQPVFSLTAQDDHGLKKCYTITNRLEENDEKKIHLIIEIACNRLLGEGKNGLINPPDMEKMFTLSQADIAVVDKDAYDAFFDLQVIYGIAKSLSDDCQRSAEALCAGNEIINSLVKGKFSDQAYIDAKNIAQKFFNMKPRDGQHVVHAMGHCHIDSAWLWPYAETIRKCARSWISVISLMEKHEDFTFTCSQAQQFAWVKEHYPQIYEKLKIYVKKGRFLLVGGTWVEMDGNLPSGEAMVRQFVYGQRFFLEEFGHVCNEFWLPDTFGYSANLPQIMREAKIHNFLTQKLSWSLFNKFPHNTFFWEGIDGTKALSHFPPGDSYGMQCNVEEFLKTLNNHKDKGRSDSSMFLFGWGDGGGGPTEDMLHRISRMKDCAGLPKVKMSTPNQFFNEVRHKSDQLCTWVGELFLELHNGTYTTHAKIKKCNRQCEILLHNVEFMSTLAWIMNVGKSPSKRGRRSENKGHKPYPHLELERLWKLLLLNQFHDVLPGSSIEMVNKDAIEYYDDIKKSAESHLESALNGLLVQNDSSTSTVINSLAWEREEVVEMPDKKLAVVTVPSLGFTTISTSNGSQDEVVSISEQNDGSITMKNQRLTCRFDRCGHLVSLSLNSDTGRELVESECFGNQMVLFDDVPLFWDAWDVMDYHLETRSSVLSVLEPLRVSDKCCPVRGALEFSLRVGEHSKLKQTIELDVNSSVVKFKTMVDWHEEHKFLKVEFPWNIRSSTATYEIQFGHLERPTHQNTSWDSARFEVWAHKWADLSQYDHGVALLNDCKYGYSTFGNVMRLSLLRSPKAPDANADMGEHEFIYAVMPHEGSFQNSGVIKQAYQLNNPVRMVPGQLPSTHQFSFAAVDTDAVILDTCKKSDMHEEAVLLRLYESFGSTVKAKIHFPNFEITNICRCNILEDIDENHKVQVVDGNSFVAQFNPFQIQTYILWLK